MFLVDLILFVGKLDRLGYVVAHESTSNFAVLSHVFAVYMCECVNVFIYDWFDFSFRFVLFLCMVCAFQIL